ncbi:hypothetical protein [Candidatus Soleaferrea massiliensis]|uniref:hypothetical protein n=1 Tax=Candidatus Soleaferrea massiliensis TaxID=1470354 RepID=UPI00058E44B1|nr:hypothetical protein [Candidatus Soleaferrea massiliensis]
MNEKKMIKAAVSFNMPDFETVRRNCLTQTAETAQLLGKSSPWIKRIALTGAFAVFFFLAIAALPAIDQNNLSDPPSTGPEMPYVSSDVQPGADMDIVINQLDRLSAYRFDAQVKRVDGKNWGFGFIDRISVPDDLNHIVYSEIYTKPFHTMKPASSSWDETSYSVLHEYDISYSNEAGKNIMISFSKDFIPLRDYWFHEAMKASAICGTELTIARYENNYMAQFRYDGMNFDLEFQNLSEEEVLDVLVSILSDS